MNNTEMISILSKYDEKILKYELENIKTFLKNDGMNIDKCKKRINKIINQNKYLKNNNVKDVIFELCAQLINDNIPTYFLEQNLKILVIKKKSLHYMNKNNVSAFVSYKKNIKLYLKRKYKNKKLEHDVLYHEFTHIASCYKNDNFLKAGLIKIEPFNTCNCKFLTESLTDIYPKGKSCVTGYNVLNIKLYPAISLLKETTRKQIYDSYFLNNYQNLSQKLFFMNDINNNLGNEYIDFISNIDSLLNNPHYLEHVDLAKLYELKENILKYYINDKNYRLNNLNNILIDLIVKKTRIKLVKTNKATDAQFMGIKEKKMEEKIIEEEKDLQDLKRIKKNIY